MLRPLKRWYQRRVAERLRALFMSHYAELPAAAFRLGAMRHNYQCHLNAAQAYYEAEGPERPVPVLVYGYDTVSDEGFLHVVSKLYTGEFRDDTLGWKHRRTRYFYLKPVPEESYERIDVWFHNQRLDFLAGVSSPRLAAFLGLEPNDII